MPIVYRKILTRAMARAEPEARFVFGDNTLRMGYGGQARELRDEPNAIGVVTKHAPNRCETSYFTDATSCHRQVALDLAKVKRALEEGRTVYVPADGLGTGLAELPQRAPTLYGAMRNWFLVYAGECPWP